jgi:hypothetical protein
MTENIFSSIYQKSSLKESTQYDLIDDWKAKFQKSKDDPNFYDLFLVNSKTKDKFVCRDAAWYQSGYDQGMGVGSRPKQYLQTIFGYNAGNGGGVESKKIPSILSVSYLKRFLIEEVVNNLNFSGESHQGKWEFEPL